MPTYITFHMQIQINSYCWHELYKYIRFPFLGRNSDSTGQKVMIARENVCREIEDNRLIAKCQLLRAYRGLQVGSHAEDTAHFAQPEITAYFGAFETDRAALGRQQIRNPSSNGYDLGVQRRHQSREQAKDQRRSR